MNKHTETHVWLCYLETPRQAVQPVKIDAILQTRLQAFMNVKKIRLLLVDDE